jgi:hypothetical protein
MYCGISLQFVTESQTKWMFTQVDPVGEQTAPYFVDIYLRKNHKWFGTVDATPSFHLAFLCSFMCMDWNN